MLESQGNNVVLFILQVDEVRINQIYEQAKWQILTEEVECTEEEAITFGALQFQVKVASQSPHSMHNNAEEVDDIEAALNDLQVLIYFIFQPIKTVLRYIYDHNHNIKDTTA